MARRGRYSRRAMTKPSLITPDDFRQIYDRFQSPLARQDCGRFCAPLNGGEPVCCSTKHAIPIVQKVEWKLLKSRTDMWRSYKPVDAASRKIAEDAEPECKAIECRGARHCERDNRSLACRAFPFFPYVDRAGKFIGLAYYWDFEDRCWVISNAAEVERNFIGEFGAAFEHLFERDPEEYTTYREHSLAMRRVFSRRRKAIPIIARAGGYLQELPYGKGLVPADASAFRKHGPYRSDAAYARAVKDAEAVVAADAEAARELR